MTRNIALLALAQAAGVVCSFVGLSAVLKHYGYPDQPHPPLSSLAVYHWSILTLFFRRFGLILLLVPVAWGVAAVKSNRRGEYILSHGLWLMIGTLLPFILIMTFFYAIFHPWVAD
jgi:hypothetical protein